MKFKLFVTALAMCACLTSMGQAKPMNPITRAMMNVYDKQLADNPNDYDVYFRRASEYYNHDQYLRALSDIENAIEYTPSTDKDMLFKEYSLRGNIYSMTGRHEEALADFKKALSLDPNSYVTIYEIANEEYELGNIQDAKADYKKLQRLNPRSPEALIGLTRIAVKEGNHGIAKDLMNQIVDLNPASASSYIRRASIRKEIGDNTGAVEDLVMAISIEGNARAVQELVVMGNVDYTATVNGLSAAIRNAPNVALFYYLRATIAMAHYRYQSALADFRTIIDQNLYNYPGLYDAMAKCYLALGNYPEALKECNFAIGMADNSEPYYVTLAKIRRAMGDYDLALEDADKAVSLAPDDNEAIVEKGLCLVSKENYKEAAELFGEAMLNNDTEPYYYLLRAWVLNDFLRQQTAATAIYRRMLDIDYPEKDVRSFRGFALLFSGNKEEGDDWMKEILRNPDNDGLLNYFGACYYAYSGNLDKAFECMERSLANGYADAYNWKSNCDARVNVQPLRNDPRFASLMSRYDYLFL